MRPIVRTRAAFTAVTCVATLLVLGAGLAAAALAVDPGSPLWTRVYGGSGNQSFRYAAGCSGGDVVAAGATRTDKTHLVVARYSASGARRWLKVVAASSVADDQPVGILTDRDGNAVVLSVRQLAAASQFLVCKLSPRGRVVWRRTLDGGVGGSNAPGGLALSAAGDVWVTGGVTPTGPVAGSLTVRLRARDGKELARRVLTGPRTLHFGRSIAVDGAGNAYITGYGDRGDGLNELITAKLRPGGSVAWLKEVPAAGNIRVNGVRVALAGSRLYVVASVGPNAPVDTILVLKYTTAGVEQWRDALNVPSNEIDSAEAVATDRYGNLFVAGASRETGPRPHAFVARWTPSKARWLLADPEGSACTSSYIGVVPDQSGGCWVAGTRGLAPLTDYRSNALYTARVSKSGSPRWEQLQLSVDNDINTRALAACAGGLAVVGTLDPRSGPADSDGRTTMIRR
jgi:hypothetical protein